jgi:hypothetical protein
MRLRSESVAALVLLLVAGTATANPPRLIYFDEDGGSGNPRGLYNFDPSTGISTLRTTVPGNQRFFGMHIRPGTSTVYALAVLPTALYTIDIDTGAATFIGAMGSDTIADIVFHPITGTLYGMGRNSPYRLYSVNPETGAATFLLNASEAVRCGMVAAPDGTFYGFSIDGVLSMLDLNTGAATLIGGTPIGGVVEDSVFASDGYIYYTMFDGRIFRTDPASGINILVGNAQMGSGLLAIIEEPGQGCYANCDQSTTTPILNVEDFTCFINEFAAATGLPHQQQLTHYANCDQSTTAPVLNVEDFTCFINSFAAGCP